MTTVSKDALQANLSEYFRKVQEDGEELIVTDNQIAVLKVVPMGKRFTVDELFADLRGKVKYHGNIVEPETDEWGDV